MPIRSTTKAARLLAGAALFATVLAACGSGGPAATPPGQSPSATPTAAATTAIAVTPKPTPSTPYAGAAAVIPVGAGPRGVAEAGGLIWVASALGNVVQGIDPATNQIKLRVQLDLPVTLVTVGAQLWVSVLNDVEPDADNELVQIDPVTGEIGRRVGVPIFHNIAAGDGSIWAVDLAGELLRVDPATGRVTSVASIGGKTVGIAANDTAVWGIRDDGAVWRVAVSGGDVAESPIGVQVPGRSRVAVAGAGHVWVGVPGTVLALDPDDLSVDLELAMPGMTLVNDLWVTETDVWLSANVTDTALGLHGGAVLRLDPTTAEVVEVYPLGPESSGVVVTGDSVWAVDQKDNVLVRYPFAR